MFIKYLLEVFNQNYDKTAVIWNKNYVRYNELIEYYKKWASYLEENYICNSVIAIRGDFTPNCIAFFLAAIEKKNIIAPFNLSDTKSIKAKLEIAQIEHLFVFDEYDNLNYQRLDSYSKHSYYQYLISKKKTGLLLFTSGTSGIPKAAVHDFENLLKKFVTPRTALKTLNFLLFDHWGGLNTMFHTLANGGTVLTLKDRTPDLVCKYIEKHKVELLPASPTFLNLMILSEAYKRYDLSTLKIISYGTEPMPEYTLRRLNQIFPLVKLQQTYGLIELGVLRSKSKENESLWVKIGGEGYDVRVVDGILQIKAESAMLGYLNAPSPFTSDGYFITGDAVEVDGDYYKILGRKSEMINVGGEKVYPREVEDVIQRFDNVEDVMVYPESNPITGQIVCAKIKLKKNVDHKTFIKDLKSYCRQNLNSYKVPVKIKIELENLFNDRFKKIRQ